MTASKEKKSLAKVLPSGRGNESLVCVRESRFAGVYISFTACEEPMQTRVSPVAMPCLRRDAWRRAPRGVAELLSRLATG